MKRSLGVAAIAIASLLDASGAAVARGFGSEVDRLVRPYLDAQKTFGLSVGILREGRSFLRGYGRFSETDDRKPDGDTLYEIASLTKIFTGVLLADSVIRGDLRLSQPAEKLLPADVRMPQNGPQPITLLHLATHVSGLPRLPSNLPNSGAENLYAGYTDALLFEFLDAHTLRRAPGDQYEYSNLAFGLLGKLIAQRSGTDYATLLQTRVTKPLRLSSTTIDVPDRKLSRLAPPHRADLEPTERWNRHALHGAGAINSSVRDLLDFAGASLAPPRSRIGAALEIAWRQHRPPVEGTDYAMGLGWFHSRDGNTRYHTGSTGGYRSAIYASRKHGVAAVVLANSKGIEADDLAVELYRMAIGRNVPAREYEPLAEVSEETMTAYVGRYETPKGGIYDVSREGEKLMVRYNDQRTYRVFPVSDTQWRYRNFEATLLFRQNDEGEWDSLELIKPNHGSVAKRLEETSNER